MRRHSTEEERETHTERIKENLDKRETTEQFLRCS